MTTRARPKRRLVTEAWLSDLVAQCARLSRYSRVLADLVEALPTCADCSAPATCRRRGEGRWCDEHAPKGCLEYPRSAPLRRALDLLAKKPAP